MTLDSEVAHLDLLVAEDLESTQVLLASGFFLKAGHQLPLSADRPGLESTWEVRPLRARKYNH